jgi:hypothetical protein
LKPENEIGKAMCSKRFVSFDVVDRKLQTAIWYSAALGYTTIAHTHTHTHTEETINKLIPPPSPNWEIKVAKQRRRQNE